MLTKDSFYFLLRILKGMLIGAAGIIPGASGGVIAVAMGEYHGALDAVYDLFRHPKTKFKSSVLHLLPLGIGILPGILGCSFLLEYLLLHYEEVLMFALIGMVLGGAPALIREGNEETGFRLHYLLYSVLGVFLVSLMALLENHLTQGVALPLNAYTAMLSGAILMIGVVIPGISTSFILMYMGLYGPMLSALTNFQIPILFCLGLGGLIMGTVLFLFVRRMFKTHSAPTHYAILGFLLGTIFLIFPGVTKENLFLDLLLFLGGLCFTVFSTQKMERIDKGAH